MLNSLPVTLLLCARVSLKRVRSVLSIFFTEVVKENSLSYYLNMPRDSIFFPKFIRYHLETAGLQVLQNHSQEPPSDGRQLWGVTEVHRRRFWVGSSCVESFLSTRLDSLQFLPTFVKHAR